MSCLNKLEEITVDRNVAVAEVKLRLNKGCD